MGGIDLKSVVFILLLMNLEVFSEQAEISFRIYENNINPEPIIKTTCEVTFPENSTQQTIIWEYEGQQLSVNGTLKADDSDRIFLQYDKFTSKERTYSSILNIYRALKSDKGNYTCLVMYYIEDNQYVEKETEFAEIPNYLPPPDYPKCSASPSVVYDGDNVTFICNPGDVNPPVNLILVLQGPEGTGTYLGNVSEITTMMTLNNSNSRFVCHMTSDTFSNVMRNCSAGPIEVTPRRSTANLPIIGGTVAGVLIIVLLIIIICLVIQRSKTSTKPSTNTDHPMDNVQSTETATTNPYVPASTTPESNPTSNQDNSMQVYSEIDKDEDATSVHPIDTSKDKSSDQDTSEDQIPVYAMSSTPSPAVNTSKGSNKITNDMPIYSQVQKDSGMVDNMIYEPARPM